MKNIKNNNKSKARVFGTILVAILVIAASFTVLFLVPHSPLSIKPASAASVNDFTYHKQATIASSYIGTALTNFPILVHDNTGNLLSNVLANGSDIAFFNSAKDTQFNHEIESYNSGTGELWAWVNVTSIASGADTIFYMYYNDSDGGYPVGHNPSSVWDSNFVGVYHMNGSATGTQYDSTSNNNDLSFSNQGADNSLVSGMIGNCINFSGGGDYYSKTDASFATPNAYSFECYIQVDVYKDYEEWACRGFIPSSDFSFLTRATEDTDSMNWYFDNLPAFYANLIDGTWYHIVFALTDNEHGLMYMDGNYVNETTGTISMTSKSNTFYLGIGQTGLGVRQPTGFMDEVRFSNVRRSADWINSSYDTQNETTGFLTLGAQDAEPAASTFTLYGLTNNRVTFAGTVGTSAWCNATGDGNEYLRENISANATTNVTDILIHIDDLNDTAAWINASNIELFVSSDNATYGSLGSFTDGGSNKSVNKSTWPGGGGTNPFDGAGIIDKKVDIYFLFKITFGAGLSTDEFYTAAIDTCWIKPGHYV